MRAGAGTEIKAEIGLASLGGPLRYALRNKAPDLLCPLPVSLSCRRHSCGHVFALPFFSDLKSEIDKLATEYISNARTLSSEEKLGLLKQIQEAYGKCKEFGDDKVQLAMQTYEMVRGTETKGTGTPMRWWDLIGGESKCVGPFMTIAIMDL